MPVRGAGIYIYIKYIINNKVHIKYCINLINNDSYIRV